ncbi:MAG: DegT/DnrJ/EryC1/StrS family aminotransferase [Chloroflexota bacterium]
MSTLAIDGGKPTRTEAFPEWPYYDEAEEKALLGVLHSKKWGLGGTQVDTFAERFAEFQDAKYGVCVPNGTHSLQLALRTLGIGHGDEVITVPFTFIATVSPILWVGAKPVFVDIEWDSFNMDASKIEDVITERTKAIMPVHLGGRPANMDGILAVAKKHNLAVIEDACQAWGGQWRDQGVGAIGHVGGFSFQSSKNINAGEGGIMLTNDSELYERAWSLHNVGRVKGATSFELEILGGNMRMTEWVAAILNVQFDRLPAQMARRQDNARYLSEAISEVSGLEPLAQDDRITSDAYHVYRLRYDSEAFGGKSRDEFVAAMREEGITTCSPGYQHPLSTSKAIHNEMTKQFGPDSVPDAEDYPITTKASQEGFWLYQSTLLAEHSDMDSVVEAAQKIQTAWS